MNEASTAKQLQEDIKQSTGAYDDEKAENSVASIHGIVSRLHRLGKTTSGGHKLATLA